MIRVLHVLGGVGLGGAESRIMDIYRQMNPEEVQFDFLVHSSRIKKAGDDMANREPEFYDEEIKRLGGHIYALPKFKVYNYFTYRKAIKSFFKEHHDYEVVQGHMTSTASIYLPIAKKAGIATTVAHSRNAGVEKGAKGVATKWFRRNLDKKADFLFACSCLAGEDVFGKRAMESGKVKIIHNAIDVRKFTYDPVFRKNMRKKLEVEDKLVLGHVGRFNKQKNHGYLLDIFAAVSQKREDAVLFLLGDGPDRAQMEEKCRELGIADKVYFEGNQKHPQEYYQAFDLFLLPSLYEGLPGVLVEAQAAGLRCLVSDTITKEAQATELVTYLSIEENPEVWADTILSLVDYEREDTRQRLSDAGFDVRKQATCYRDFYLEKDVTML